MAIIYSLVSNSAPLASGVQTGYGGATRSAGLYICSGLFQSQQAKRRKKAIKAWWSFIFDNNKCKAQLSCYATIQIAKVSFFTVTVILFDKVCILSTIFVDQVKAQLDKLQNLHRNHIFFLPKLFKFSFNAENVHLAIGNISLAIRYFYPAVRNIYTALFLNRTKLVSQISMLSKVGLFRSKCYLTVPFSICTELVICLSELIRCSHTWIVNGSDSKRVSNWCIIFVIFFWLSYWHLYYIFNRNTA